MDNIYTSEIMERKILLKKLFSGIFILNLFDSLFMHILVKANMNQEITEFMKPMTSKPLLVASIKIGLVLYMLSLIYKHIDKADVQKYRTAIILYTLLLGFYAAIVWMESIIFGAWVMVNK